MISWPWLIWGFGCAGIAIVSFAIMEYRAFQKGTHLNTLSRATWLLSQKFPLAIVAFTAVLFSLIGGLSVHFFWHWCPELTLPGVGG